MLYGLSLLLLYSSVIDEVQGERAFVLERRERRTLREYLEHSRRRGVIEAFLKKSTSAGSARVHATCRRDPGCSLYYPGKDAEKRFAVLGREWMPAGGGR
ncbi:hypothetical protein WMF04_25535 [Sorangium sp. So ce260]|uniref:hypothetical protein n=1 Tax=Sorangium sp. So ce260 TaxID=3133291 RepID=UPI003F61B407